MAYCLNSLVQILEQILHPEQHHQNWVIHHDKIPQLQSLLKTAYFLTDSLSKVFSPVNSARFESLEDRIRVVAENAEVILESHITTQLLSSTEGESFTIFFPDLHEVIGELESTKEEMINIMDVNQGLNNKSLVVPSRHGTSPRNMVVGVTEDLKQLKYRLMGQSSELEVIPIVGMGGSGKTTLARILYDEYSPNKSHFDVCAWVTVSEHYDLRRILLTLLDSVFGKSKYEQETNQLVVKLYQSLFSRRYLIVLDDIWSSEAWDDVQRAFPRDNQRSRIILTTRKNHLADYVESKSHQMSLLNKDFSWELLRKKVYGEEPCPQELEDVGKRIANSCKGLPLAVQVIGGLLSQEERSKDSWEQVASNVRSTMETANEQFPKIFSVSYAHLPHYLKPCILYMCAFPDDYEIRASKLINLWVADGFLIPILHRSLEEAAKIYLKALVDRNLIFVREIKHNGEAKSYGIHDLLRHLCLRKAEEKKFLFVEQLKNYDPQEEKILLRRISVHRNDHIDVVDSFNLKPFARSFQMIGFAARRKLFDPCFEFSLLRVLDMTEGYLPEFPEEILKLVNLRYLALMFIQEMPKSISMLKNLQTIIFEVTSIESLAVIFDLPQLRYIKLSGDGMMNFPYQVDISSTLQENLHTLCTVPLGLLTKLLGKIPNLRKLRFYHDTSTDNLNLVCLHKLETLKFSGDLSHKTKTFLRNLILPVSLKKLTLSGYKIPQTFFHTIGMLPNLEVLKLEDCKLESSIWEPSEGEFCRLQYLELYWLSNLNNWLATETHFPELRHLVIRLCLNLEEIPVDFGEINTLEIIEVDESNPTVLDSARRIIKEQHELGNSHLQLHLSKSIQEPRDFEEVELEEDQGEEDDEEEDNDEDLEEEFNPQHESFTSEEKPQSLSIIPLSMLEQLLGKYPNLRKLGIRCVASNDIVDLTSFHELEILKCYSSILFHEDDILCHLIFPHSLKILTLFQCSIPPAFITMIGWLPNLEVLKIRSSISESSIWKPVEGGFLRLKYLLFNEFIVTRCLLGPKYFPELRHLVIENCGILKDITAEVVTIPTLETIKVDKYSILAIDSVRSARKCLPAVKDADWAKLLHFLEPDIEISEDFIDKYVEILLEYQSRPRLILCKHGKTS